MFRADGKNRRHMIIIQAVINRFAVPSEFDEFGILEYPQLMRYRALCHLQYFRDIRDTQFSCVQRIQDLDSRGVSEYLEYFREIIQFFFIRK